MAELTPEGFNLAVRTRLAYAVAVRDIIDYAFGLLATYGEANPTLDVDNGPLFDPAEGVLTARRLAALHNRAKTLAVCVAALTHGATWPQIAARLGVAEDVARHLYQDAVLRWASGDPAPWLPKEVGRRARFTGAPAIEVTSRNAKRIAAGLDAWYAEHVTDRVGREVPDAVSGGLGL